MSANRAITLWLFRSLCVCLLDVLVCVRLWKFVCCNCVCARLCACVCVCLVIISEAADALDFLNRERVRKREKGVNDANSLSLRE